MSAGVAGLQEKLNKSLHQKGMVSGGFIFYYHAVGACNEFLGCPCPTKMLGLSYLLTVGGSERKVWQNDWEEGEFC